MAAWSAMALATCRVGVAEVGRALPADAVDVFAPVRVPQVGALPAHDGDGAFGVQAGGVLVFEVDNFIEVRLLSTFELFQV